MSWCFSLAQVGQSWLVKSLDTESLRLLKSAREQRRRCYDAKKTVPSNLSPSSTDASVSSAASRGVDAWISYQRDSLANPSASQTGGESKIKTLETDGQTQPELSTRFVQGTLFSKTSQESEGTSQRLPELLPIWATVAGSEWSALERPEPSTSGKDGGAWPTPQARDWKGAHGPRYVNKERSNDLNDAVDYHENYAVTWPTPTASDHKGGTATPRRDTGKPRMDRLDHVLEPRGHGKLSPDWVEWLMMWPIGWTSLEPINPDMVAWWVDCMTTDPGSYSESDPADIPVGMKYHTPRLTDVIRDRANRLKSIGNGQVPAQLILALKLLQEAK